MKKILFCLLTFINSLSGGSHKSDVGKYTKGIVILSKPNSMNRLEEIGKPSPAPVLIIEDNRCIYDGSVIDINNLGTISHSNSKLIITGDINGIYYEIIYFNKNQQL